MTLCNVDITSRVQRGGAARAVRAAGRPARTAASLFAALLVGGSTACDPGPPVPASVAVAPTSLGFASLADTARLTATVRDESGEVIVDPAIVWSSRDGAVARVEPAGQPSGALVTSVADGSTTISATAGGSDRHRARAGRAGRHDCGGRRAHGLAHRRRLGADGRPGVRCGGIGSGRRAFFLGIQQPRDCHRRRRGLGARPRPGSVRDHGNAGAPQRLGRADLGSASRTAGPAGPSTRPAAARCGRRTPTG